MFGEAWGLVGNGNLRPSTRTTPWCGPSGNLPTTLARSAPHRQQRPLSDGWTHPSSDQRRCALAKLSINEAALVCATSVITEVRSIPEDGRLVARGPLASHFLEHRTS